MGEHASSAVREEPQVSPGNFERLKAVTARNAWIRDLRAELCGPKGWKLFGEILAGIAALWGLLLGVMTYHSAHLVDLKDAAEQSYGQLLHDLEHDSKRVRIGAIQRIPEVMLRQVPVSESLGPMEAIRLTFGGKRHSVAAYHNNMQRAIRLHLADLNAGNKDWSLEEVEAFTALLADLGPEGWYKAEAMPSPPPRTEGLAWLWHSTSGNSEDPTSLFENVKLAGINFQQFDLTSADFRGAILDRANITFARLSHSNLAGAALNATDLSETDLRFSHLENASLVGAYMTGSLLEGANFRFARLSDSHLQGAKCPQCVFQNASLDGIFALGADMTSADLSFSSMRLANFERATLRSANLSYARATGAKFGYSVLDGTRFANADLRNADFSHVVGIDKVANWTNANVAGVTGLSLPEYKAMIQKGAIAIASEDSWKAYREAGRPHAKWRGYAVAGRHRR